MSSRKDGKGTCELNKHDISPINDNINFHDQQGVAFFVKLKVICCPQDWVLHGNSCYHVIDTPTLKWSDARTTCQNLGTDLAIIRSEEENNFTIELLKKQKKVTYFGTWLGLGRNPSAEDAFYWIDGTPLAGQFSAWASSEPNNLREKFVHIYATPRSNRQGQWNDKECSFSDAGKSQPQLFSARKGSRGYEATFWSSPGLKAKQEICLP
ncbi:CD209 antigen-like protein A [Orbicella faveolata]|uniref:CD209 antigen-like protein A n=1 Tax=Orbicella faveolata TaxID=48498 RepID=UPI0009E55D9E|nr:CD209 antigen-like protein A [Orbicella faveolata]